MSQSSGTTVPAIKTAAETSPIPSDSKASPSTTSSSNSAAQTTAQNVAASKPAKPPRPPNPVFRMMGLPNLPKKLPSRNWLIFWSVVFSFTAAKLYDNREKKRIQKKWCDLVAHIAEEKVDVKQMPRKLTVFLAAPPGDGIGASRTYFKEYVKPVLVASSQDYEVIEGRKEGDVRFGTAENIRRLRRQKGERGKDGAEPEMDAARAVEMMRERAGVTAVPQERGDLILGRHTWKEYIRGIHEGWLGPLDQPAEPQKELDAQPEPSPIHPPTEPRTTDPAATTAPEVVVETLEDQNKIIDDDEKKTEADVEAPKLDPRRSWLPVEQYSSAQLSQYTPVTFAASEPIRQQHLVGFLKTPQRIYNFLTRRYLTDEVGRQTAAIVLRHSRPYQYNESFAVPSAGPTESAEAAPIATRAPENDVLDHSAPIQTGRETEQDTLLQREERTWHKSARKALGKDEIPRERVLTEPMIFDDRILQRMRRFVLDPDEEERAQRLANGDKDACYAREKVNLEDQTVLMPEGESLDRDSFDA